MCIVLYDFEVFSLGPVVDAVFLADHEGPFFYGAVIIVGLLGVAALAFEDKDGWVFAFDARGGHFLLAVAASWLWNFHMCVTHENSKYSLILS